MVELKNVHHSRKIDVRAVELECGWHVRVGWSERIAGVAFNMTFDLLPGHAIKFARRAYQARRFEFVGSSKRSAICFDLSNAEAQELSRTLTSEAVLAGYSDPSKLAPAAVPVEQVRRVLSYINGERDDGMPHPPDVQTAMDELYAWVRVHG